MKNKLGPIYSVQLINTLKLGNMLQAMPSREDLEQIEKINSRVVAGYEVLLSKYRRLLEACISAQDNLPDLIDQQAMAVLIGECAPVD